MDKILTSLIATFILRSCCHMICPPPGFLALLAALRSPVATTCAPSRSPGFRQLTLPAPSASEPRGMRLFASVKAPPRYRTVRPGRGPLSRGRHLDRNLEQSIDPKAPIGVRADLQTAPAGELTQHHAAMRAVRRVEAEMQRGRSGVRAATITSVM
jgi:hypothetical protein